MADEIKKEKKHWYKSRTVWFNIISVAVCIASAAINPSLFNSTTVAIGTTIVSIGNIFLRAITTEEIKFSS